MHRIDGPGATVDNKFTEGDPVGGVQATVVTDDWLTAVQEEICSVITDPAVVPAIPLNKAANNQLITALKRLFGQATELVLGAAKVATQAQTNAGTDDATIVTPKKLRFGFASSLTANGYITFPSWLGGLILQWGTVSGTSGGVATATFSIGFNTVLHIIPFYQFSSDPTSITQNGGGGVFALSNTGASFRLLTGFTNARYLAFGT